MVKLLVFASITYSSPIMGFFIDVMTTCIYPVTAMFLLPAHLSLSAYVAGVPTTAAAVTESAGNVAVKEMSMCRPGTSTLTKLGSRHGGIFECGMSGTCAHGGEPCRGPLTANTKRTKVIHFDVNKCL